MSNITSSSTSFNTSLDPRTLITSKYLRSKALEVACYFFSKAVWNRSYLNNTRLLQFKLSGALLYSFIATLAKAEQIFKKTVDIRTQDFSGELRETSDNSFLINDRTLYENKFFCIPNNLKIAGQTTAFSKQIVPLLLSSLWIGCVRAQTTFVQTWGGPNQDILRAISINGHGEIIGAGYTNSYGAGNDDVLLANWSANKTLNWAISLGGAEDDAANALGFASDESIVTAGYTSSFGAGDQDLLLASWKAQGTLNWATTLGGENDDVANCIGFTTDDNIVAAGHTTSFGAGGQDVLLAQWSSSGNLIWAKTLGGGSSDWASALGVSSDNSIIIAGGTMSSGEGDEDVLIAKLSTDGVVIWAKTIGQEHSDYATALVLIEGGGIGISGALSTNSDRSAVLVARLSETGVLGWARIFEDLNSKSSALVKAEDGGFVTTGYGDDKIILAKLTASGTTSWTRIIDGDGSDYLDSLAISDNNSIIGGGYTNSFSESFLDVLIAKFSALNPDLPGCANLVSEEIHMSQSDLSGSLMPSDVNASVIVQNWINASTANWTTVSSTIISISLNYQCQSEQLTTGMATTGSISTGQFSSEATTGTLTTGIRPSTPTVTTTSPPSGSGSSPSSSSQDLNIVLGVSVTAGAVAAIAGLAALGAFAFKKYKQMRKIEQKLIELQTPQSLDLRSDEPHNAHSNSLQIASKDPETAPTQALKETSAPGRFSASASSQTISLNGSLIPPPAKQAVQRKYENVPILPYDKINSIVCEKPNINIPGTPENRGTTAHEYENVGTMVIDANKNPMAEHTYVNMQPELQQNASRSNKNE